MATNAKLSYTSGITLLTGWQEETSGSAKREREREKTPFVSFIGRRDQSLLHTISTLSFSLSLSLELLHTPRRNRGCYIVSHEGREGEGEGTNWLLNLSPFLCFAMLCFAFKRKSPLNRRVHVCMQITSHEYTREHFSFSLFSFPK